MRLFILNIPPQKGFQEVIMYKAKLIDGNETALQLRSKVKQNVEIFTQRFKRPPGLAVILVGEDPASEVYVKSKAKATEEAGMISFKKQCDASISQEALLHHIDSFNRDNRVDGILVQLPLPNSIDASSIIQAIDPKKDVDGFHILNKGLLAIGALDKALIPCTPLGCLYLLQQTLPTLKGKKALVIGRSHIVGQPMAQLLVQHHATVTIAHSHTENIQNECRQADIIIAAVGKPHFVKGEWVKEGATLIDVGIHRIKLEDGKTKLTGDIDFGQAAMHAAFITPVPGGVGPMTIACLLENTLKAAYLRCES